MNPKRPPRRYEYTRWIACWDIKLDRVCAIARAAGMAVLSARKPNMNCWHHIRLWGDCEQMRTVERRWQGRRRKNAIVVHNRRPEGAWPIRRVPKPHQAELELNHDGDPDG